MRNRLVWADSLKGALMLLVMLGHSIQYVEGETCYENHLWNFIYSFHMPVFMAISGYFAPGNGGGKLLTIQKRFIQLLVPYFSWSLLWYVTDSTKQIRDIVLLPDRYYWFLWVLFFINVLFMVSRLIADKLRISEEIAIFSMAFCLIIFMVTSNFRLFGFQFISYYFLFYVLGYLMSKYNILSRINFTFWLFLFLLWLVLAWNWNMHKLPVWVNISFIPSSILQFVYRGCTAIVGLLVFQKMAMSFMNKKDKYIDSFCWIGRYSLCFYTAHLLIIKPIKSIIIDITYGSLILQESVLFLTIAILSFVVIKIILPSRILTTVLMGK